MIKKYTNTIPYFFSAFLILALIPQLLGFNGTAVDDIFKIGLICLLALKTASFSGLNRVSTFSVLFIILSIGSCICTIAVNDINAINEAINSLMSILLVVVLVELLKEYVPGDIYEILCYYRIYVYFILAASIYNMVIHFNSLLHITSLSVYGREAICSFFDNKNTFGVFLIFGVLASTILNILTNEKQWLFISGIFLINELMAMCRTAIAMSSALMIMALLIDHKHRLRNILILAVVLLGGILLFVKNASVNFYITETLFGSQASIDARNLYIENLLPMATGTHLWFGYGNEGAMALAWQYMGNRYYHNGYLKMLMSGGILKIVVEFMAIALSVRYAYACRRMDCTIGNLCLLSVLVYLIYITAESVVLFDKPVVAIMAVMFILSMPILFYNYLYNGRETVEIENEL